MILACDSMGVRSLATKIGKLLLDPAAALGPRRYSLPPHPLELSTLKIALKKINEEINKSKFISISHYHYDHYLPEANYENKTLYIKDTKNNINKSQKERSSKFLKHLSTQNVNIVEVDGQDLGWVEFSPAVPHGPDKSRLGFVIMTHLKKEKLIHASDIQGPQSEEATNWIIERNPKTLLLSGFPTIFLGWRISYSSLEKSNELLKRIIKETEIKNLILDHHLVRDKFYKRKIESVIKFSKDFNTKILTGAEFEGKQNNFLEAKRKERWETSPYPLQKPVLLTLLTR